MPSSSARLSPPRYALRLRSYVFTLNREESSLGVDARQSNCVEAQSSVPTNQDHFRGNSDSDKEKRYWIGNVLRVCAFVVFVRSSGGVALVLSN